MRIVSGTFRSRTLKTLKGDNTRPTSDKIRGAIFDSIAFDTNYKSFLDLFSGSGAMGLEALSRGYQWAIFNDKSRDAINIIKQNIKALNVNKQSTVYNLDYKQCLKQTESVDLIFIDPPYDKFDLKEVVEMISDLSLVNDEGMIIIEGSSQTNLEDNIKEFYKYKEKDYKSTRVIYYRKG